MPLPTSACQRCQTPVTWRVVDDMPAPFEEDGGPHRDRCTARVAWGKARSVEEPRLIRPALKGFVIGIDLETTGIPGRIEDPEIIEIAAALLRLEDGAVVDTFSSLVKPRGPLLAQEVHQISEEMVADAPGIEAVIARFNAWRRAAQAAYQETPIPLVSHNAAFELSFLDPCDVEGPWICTLVMSQESTAGRTARGFHSLGSIVERMGLQYEGAAHRALPDAQICAQVYWMMTLAAREWEDLAALASERLGDVRCRIAEVAPVTASLMLDLERELARRLRLFQDRPRGRPSTPEMPQGWRFPFEPPEIEQAWPYRFHDPLVFRPLPEALRILRKVYRAERLGLDLTQLAQLRARPEFQEPAAWAPPVREAAEEPRTRSPHQPEFSFQAAPTRPRVDDPRPTPSLPREDVPQPSWGQRAAEEPVPLPDDPLTPATPRQAPVTPTFGDKPRPAPRPATASDGWPPPRADADRPRPPRPQYGKGH